MTQEALSLEADMKRSYLSELEAGKRNPTVRALGRLAIALEVEAAELLRQPSGPPGDPDENDVNSDT